MRCCLQILGQSNCQLVVNPAVLGAESPCIAVFCRDEHILGALDVIKELHSPGFAVNERHIVCFYAYRRQITKECVVMLALLSAHFTLAKTVPHSITYCGISYRDNCGGDRSWLVDWWQSAGYVSVYVDRVWE